MAINYYSERQVALIRDSGRIVAECLAMIRDAVKPGVTTRQLDQIAADHIRKSGGRSPFKGYQFPGKTPFPASVCASVNNVIVHGIPDDVPLVEGDLVSIDVGVSKNGYIGDSAWTFPVGTPDEAANRLLAAGEESLNAGITAMKPNGVLGEVSKAIQNLVESRGFSVVREFVGHGVGQTLHEDPQVRNYVQAGDFMPGFRVMLKPGMVLAVEPMVNERAAGVHSNDKDWPVRTADGGRSVHFEHTLAIMKDRVEILTRI